MTEPTYSLNVPDALFLGKLVSKAQEAVEAWPIEPEAKAAVTEALEAGLFTTSFGWDEPIDPLGQRLGAAQSMWADVKVRGLMVYSAPVSELDDDRQLFTDAELVKMPPEPVGYL